MPSAPRNSAWDAMALTCGPSGASLAEPALKAKGLDVTLGSVQVLFGVDLEVAAGQVVAYDFLSKGFSRIDVNTNGGITAFSSATASA